MMMGKEESRGLVRCGREISSEELEAARETVKLCWGLSRAELAETICEHWDWVTASGAGKATACLNVLEELERNGELQLPARQKRPKTERVRGAEHTPRTAAPDEAVVGKLGDVSPVRLDLVEEKDRAKLWNEYLDRYHYLEYRKPFGCTLRYFIGCERGWLGCVLVAGAAKAIKTRDEWIGWSKQRRQQNLPWVINNTRLLIFPWVEIGHLASHVLGQLARRVREDWPRRWGYEPLLMETFVDPAEFSGTCYRAAGWIELGRTTGQGLCRKGHAYRSTPKRIYVKALAKDFRERLCSGALQGRVVE
ncbi:MAG: DUF4338 domain-containing protein [Kiritimatiellia bacterium]|jgi:hypothetical protein|nr:DUF4338 domain-containing protein [Kiritimatiellia bacterium]